MAEYITKDQAYDAAMDGISNHNPCSSVYIGETIGDTIDAVPSADVVEVVHGRWIESDHGSYLCSMCGEDWVLNDGTPGENHMNYCPRCGARMSDSELKFKLRG